MNDAMIFFAILNMLLVQANGSRDRFLSKQNGGYEDARNRFLGSRHRPDQKKRSSKSASYKQRPASTPPPPATAPPPNGPQNCDFVFKYRDIKFFQIDEGGPISDYQQVQGNQDRVTICAGNKCVGEPEEVVGVASGNCIQNVQDNFVFTFATDEEPDFLDFQIFCPDVAWQGGGECVAIDITTEEPVLPFPNVTAAGPAITIRDIQFLTLVQCRIACTPRPQ